MLISVLGRVYGAKRGAELVFVACFKKPVGEASQRLVIESLVFVETSVVAFLGITRVIV